jgi:hypothetical protein
MTLPLVACVTCQKTIEDSEITAGSVRLCEHCDAVPWYHTACLGGANCPTCGTALTVADEWSPRQPKLDQRQWADEDRPAQQPPASWEDVVARPTSNDAWWTQLYRFLQNPPAATEWDNLGYQNGGHELRWYGESSGVFGPGNVDVHFHIHFTGRSYDGNPDWTYGGAWITGVHGMALDIQQNVPLHATVLPVVSQHWAAILVTEKGIQEMAEREKGDSWRRKN